MNTLPPIPCRPGSSVIRNLWVVGISWLVYTIVLSDFGLLAHCCDMEEWVFLSIKLMLPALLFSFMPLYDFILLLRRRIRWWEWPVSLLLFWITWCQMLFLNVSPLD